MQCLVPSVHIKFNKSSQCENEDKDDDNNNYDDNDYINNLL